MKITRKLRISAAAVLSVFLTGCLSGCRNIAATEIVSETFPVPSEKTSEIEAPATEDTSGVYTCFPDAVFFYQKDEKWKDDNLGASVYKMEDSGCLTCCVAAEMQMKGVSAEGLAPDADAGELNRFFSDNGVYDGEGNLVWESFDSVTGLSTVKIEQESIEEDTLEKCLDNGNYPVVRVKRKVSGNYHYVLIIGKREDGLYCMDPLNEDGTPVSMNEYDNTVYAVRYFE